MKQLFDTSSYSCSRLVTKTYSTSFSKAITLLAPSVRPAIYAIYGFVRCADEIVDSFHSYNQEELLKEFEQNYYKALERKISLNPLLNAFQEIVHSYKLYDLVDSFMHSMKMDLHKNSYQSVEEYKDYIYGSADVVGLMCLKVFCDGDQEKFDELVTPAMKLGSAFQKVNFLRDLREDTETLGRNYFSELNSKEFCDKEKRRIIEDIEVDFKTAFEGIKRLPGKSKLAVLLAYYYYRVLLNKLKKTPASVIMQNRVRIPNYKKMLIMVKAKTLYNLGLV